MNFELKIQSLFFKVNSNVMLDSHVRLTEADTAHRCDIMWSDPVVSVRSAKTVSVDQSAVAMVTDLLEPFLIK